MVVVAEPDVETWSPDFSSSGLANPIWTRLRLGKMELTNSLEFVEWSHNPVQVVLCDCCGSIGCASGGYVHISRFNDLVLWTAPQLVPPHDENLAEQQDVHFTIKKHGAIAFPLKVWSRLAAVPAPWTLSTANGRAIADAWALGPGRPVDLKRLPDKLRARLVGADRLDRAAAIQWVEHWFGWFHERCEVAMKGSLRSPAEIGAEIETLYFDGPREEDWPALAQCEAGCFPVLDHQTVFVPAESSTFSLDVGE